MDVGLLIPAYNPDEKLLTLLDALIQRGFDKIVVVNDGSKKECEAVFEKVRQIKKCILIEHAVNLGKGRALKTGLNECLLSFPDCAGVITADADGQHTPDDIARVAAAMAENPKSMVIGCRVFSKKIPFRSLFGNVVTKYVFFLVVGKMISDTQSGLRGIPLSLLPLLIKLEGERYEYEMNMLISTKLHNIPLVEVPIQTIYIDDNQSSHFNPLVDSAKIYFLLLRFGFSSLSTSLLDLLVFSLTYEWLTKNILASIIIARVVASVYNFSLNKQVVFHNREKIASTIIKYYLLLIVMMAISYTLIETLSARLGWNVIILKVMVETVLFFASFTIQRDFVFAKKTSGVENEED